MLFRSETHSEWLYRIHEETKRSKETFITHYKKNYEHFPKLPLWMAVEVMSFGALSKLISNLNRKYQAMIGRELGFHHSVLISWIHSLNFIRNVCAHHARLWNREIAISVKKPKSKDWENVTPKRIGSILYIINTVLKTVPSATEFRKDWKKEIEGLISGNKHRDFIVRGMRFSSNHELWKN